MSSAAGGAGAVRFIGPVLPPVMRWRPETTLEPRFAAAYENGSEGAAHPVPTQEDLLLMKIDEGRAKVREAPPDFEYLFGTIRDIVTAIEVDEGVRSHTVFVNASLLAIEMNYFLSVHDPTNKKEIRDLLRKLYAMIQGYTTKSGFISIISTATAILRRHENPLLNQFLDREDEKLKEGAAGGAGAGGGRRKRKYTRKYRKGRKGGSRNKRRATQ